MSIYFGYSSGIDFISELQGKKAGVLFSYYSSSMRKHAEQFIQDFPQGTMIDSGAFSWYTKHVGKGVKVRDYSWTKSKEFLNYFQAYMTWVKKQKLDDIGVPYVGLDVIGNGELTYDLWKKMKEAGLKNPMIVWHARSNEDYLLKYVQDDSIDYIGIGGIAVLLTSRKNEVFKYLKSLFGFLRNTVGPEVLMKKKFHLFGCTAIDILKALPYDTADSASYIMTSIRGGLYIPLGEGYDIAVLYIPKHDSKSKNTRKIATEGLRNVSFNDEILFKTCKEMFGVEEFNKEVIEELMSPGKRTIWNFKVFKEVYSKIVEKYTKEMKLFV